MNQWRSDTRNAIKLIRRINRLSPGCDQVHVVQKQRLLNDNGSSYLSGVLVKWLHDEGMNHSRGRYYQAGDGSHRREGANTGQDTSRDIAAQCLARQWSDGTRH